MEENRKFAVLADSNSDLGEELRRKFEIDYIHGHIVVPERGDIPAPLDWNTFGRDEFYADLKRRPEAYATSPANVAEFAAAFEGYVKEGRDALTVCLSSGISGAYHFACLARDEILAKYPAAHIRVIDTLRFGPAIGLMAVTAAEMRDRGMSADEAADWLETNKNRFHQAGWLDDLTFVARKGRITHPKAFFGTLVGVKPIGEFDYNGLTTVIGKAKGAKRAYAALLSYMEATGEDLSDQIIFIAQSLREEQAIRYRELIEEKFHPRAIYINEVFPSVGINVGPGLMAAYYVGKPISEGLREERDLLNRLTGQ